MTDRGKVLASLRAQYYIDPAVQVPVVLAMILVVTGQSLFVGWGFSRIISLAKDWENPEQVFHFFEALFLTLIPLVALNFVLGVWLSHKLAGPLLRIRRGMAEITRGNLEGEVVIRKGDLLHEHVRVMNTMLDTLRRLLYRDHGLAMEIDEIMTQARQAVKARKDLSDDARKELESFITNAKSRLSIINAHFMKGRLETPSRDQEAE